MRAILAVLIVGLAIGPVASGAASDLAADALADLTVSDFTATFTLREGTQYPYTPYNEYEFDVTNAGSADALNVQASFVYGVGVTIRSGATLGDVPAGETRHFVILQNSVAIGRGCLTVDPANAIAESDEGNNEVCAVTTFGNLP